MNKHGFYTKCVEIEKYQVIVAQRDALLRVIVSGALKMNPNAQERAKRLFQKWYESSETDPEKYAMELIALIAAEIKTAVEEAEKQCDRDCLKVKLRAYESAAKIAEECDAESKAQARICAERIRSRGEA